MTENEALALMVAPGQVRPSKPYRGGVIQIWTTNVCDKACFNCTQLGNIQSPRRFISVENFEKAVESLAGYFGVVGMFGANCALHPEFEALCLLLRKHVPKEQRGIWCNNPITLEKAQLMRETFTPGISNLNVHLDRKAYDLFKQGWPECGPVGLHEDSRHSPPFVAMRDVLKKECKCMTVDFPGNHEHPYPPCPFGMCDGSGQVYDEERAWELISGCDINQHWSAGIGEFRGQARAYFCEIAMAQALLHQDEPNYPDTGIPVPNEQDSVPWWQLPMLAFAGQVRKHCHECGVPLRGKGELAQAKVGCEQVSRTHAMGYNPKRRDRPVQLVDRLEQIGVGRLKKVTNYLGNAREG